MCAHVSCATRNHTAADELEGGEARHALLPRERGDLERSRGRVVDAALGRGDAFEQQYVLQSRRVSLASHALYVDLHAAARRSDRERI